MAIHPVFHVSLVRKAPQNVRLPNRPEPETINEGEEPEYEVEEILEARKRYNDLWFRVKWKGYPSEESTYKKWDDLENAQEAVEEFYRKNPRAPRREDVMKIDGAFLSPSLEGRAGACSLPTECQVKNTGQVKRGGALV